MSARGLDPELVAEQIDLAFRVLEDMERFLAESKRPSCVFRRVSTTT
jgi:hypothetical protein